MFCPKCRAEYEMGLVVCSECGIPLVSELESTQTPEFVEFDEILTTFNPGDIAIIKSLLDCEDIVYYFHGEHFNYIEPLVQPTRLMVRRDQVSEAKEILKDLNITFTLKTNM